jgi:hypothetical protein
MRVVGFPTVPTALLALAFQANLANASVSPEDRHSLVVGEQSLIILKLKPRIRLQKFPQEVVVPPLNAILTIRAVTGLFLVLHDLGVTLVQIQLALVPTIGFKADEPIGQMLMRILDDIAFQQMRYEHIE